MKTHIVYLIRFIFYLRCNLLNVIPRAYILRNFTWNYRLSTLIQLGIFVAHISFSAVRAVLKLPVNSAEFAGCAGSCRPARNIHMISKHAANIARLA